MSGFSLFGVNLSGAEYNPGATKEGTNYIYPSDAEIDYYASKGMTVIRLPFLLERVEPVAGGPLSATELGYIDHVVDYAASKGIDVILDPHDFGDEYGTVVGTTAASNATFANFWGELAGHFASTPNVLFGLMNEPHAVTPTQWLASANAAIAAIRAAGATSQQILVPGTDWDGAASWVSSGNAQVLGSGIVDPSHNFAFEVHQYLDSDGSGTHSSVVSTAIGVERLTAITQWAEATGNKLFLGEFGVASDPTSLTALNNMLGYMAQHTDVWEGGTYWAGGPWWGSYMYSVEPTNGVDKPQMAVLERYLPIQTDGSTSLTQVANEYFLYGASGTSGPSLKDAGAAVTVGEFGVAPIGAIKTATGYDIALKVSGTNELSFWATDNNGNYLSTIASHVSGTSFAAESLETTFGQDLNGDGTIGPTKTVIQTDGPTSLTQVANEYFLSGASGTSGPSLKYAGAAVTVGEFSVAPIGAIKTATGYDIALKVSGTNELSFWATDNNGNYLSTIASHVSGTSFAAESLETTFGQDLNGDGTIGPTKTVIQTDGPTSLTQVANEYFLYGAGGTSGPSLKDGGTAVTVGEFSAVPIGAIKTATGYDIAWQMPGTNEFTFWTTDSNGNYTSKITGLVPGTNATLKSLEATFYQDLSGDGVINTPATVIDVKGHVVLPLSSVTQPAAIEAGATLELTGADSGSVTFKGSTGTLILDHSSAFIGEIYKFSGNGNPSSSDQIDLRDINFASGTTTESFTGTSSGGTLTIRDAHNDTANILLSGNYTNSTFTLSSDGHGGTVVIDPPAKQDHLATDSFVFKDTVARSTQVAGEPATIVPMIAGLTDDTHPKAQALLQSVNDHHDFDNHAGDAFSNWHMAYLHDHNFIIR